MQLDHDEINTCDEENLLADVIRQSLSEAGDKPLAVQLFVSHEDKQIKAKRNLADG